MEITSLTDALEQKLKAAEDAKAQLTFEVSVLVKDFEQSQVVIKELTASLAPLTRPATPWQLNWRRWPTCTRRLTATPRLLPRWSSRCATRWTVSRWPTGASPGWRKAGEWAEVFQGQDERQEVWHQAQRRLRPHGRHKDLAAVLRIVIKPRGQDILQGRGKLRGAQDCILLPSQLPDNKAHERKEQLLVFTTERACNRKGVIFRLAANSIGLYQGQNQFKKCPWKQHFHFNVWFTFLWALQL